MNRILKFRGQTIGGEWVTGNLSILKKDFSSTVKKGYYISNSAGAPFAFMVRPESVGQFTGLHDKNGVEIYEGDMLKRTISFVIGEGRQPSIYYDKVVYSGGGFKTVRVDDENRGRGYLENYVGHTIEVIGNIHTQDGGQEG